MGKFSEAFGMTGREMTGDGIITRYTLESGMGDRRPVQIVEKCRALSQPRKSKPETTALDYFVFVAATVVGIFLFWVTA